MCKIKKYLKHGYDRLEKFKTFKQGWDFFNTGEPLQTYSLEKFNLFINVLEENIFHEVPSIFMDIDGFLTLEWEVEDFSYEIEFNKEYYLWIEDDEYTFKNPLNLIKKIKEIK